MYKSSLQKKRQLATLNKQTKSEFPVPRKWLRTAGLTLSVVFVTHSFSLFIAQANAGSSLDRLSTLLAETPPGGWVKANTNFFSDVWPTGADGVQVSSQQFPGAIVTAWSSFAWDSANQRLMLWGGGHANYYGNEMYVWEGATGKWERGSLPSRVDANGFIVDSAAPQSSHTYDNNVYLPVNGMFLTFGGAAAPSGWNFQKTDGTSVSRAGPYVWDPLKSDPNKVGGTTGSGWNTVNVAQGGNMWIDRQGQWTGSDPGQYINGTTAYRTENGHDVVYLTAEQGSASGFPFLYRYTLGDIRNGGKDTWEVVGVTNNTVGYQGAATIDTTHNLYIRTATPIGPYTSALAIWDLDNANTANPYLNQDVGIHLIKEDGSDFIMNGSYGIDYDSANNTIVLWNNSDGGGGDVWLASVVTDAAGKIGSNTTWIVHEIPSLTLEHPQGNFYTGVLGKWHYDAALNAFIGLDGISSTTGGALDAGVWLYKPLTAITAVVPEPETYALFLAGLGLVGWVVRRRQGKPATQGSYNTRIV